MMQLPSLTSRMIPLAVLAVMTAAFPALLRAEPHEARAVVKSLDRAVLSGELAAKILSLPKRPGDHFNKADLLVSLDCKLYQAQTEKVAAENRAAKIKMQNTEQLNKLHSIGALDVAMAYSEYEQTAAMLKIARLNTSRCEIHAPFSGRVVALYVNQHENVSPQQQLIEIVADQHLELEIVVPATWLRWLTTGAQFSATIDETGRTHKATVVTLNPVIDPVSQTIIARAQVDNCDTLIPGMSATAVFPERPAAGN